MINYGYAHNIQLCITLLSNENIFLHVFAVVKMGVGRRKTICFFCLPNVSKSFKTLVMIR